MSDLLSDLVLVMATDPVPPSVAGLVPGTGYDWSRMVQRLGQQMRAARHVLGWSQDALAEAAASSQGTVSRLESGECMLTPLVSYAKVGAALTRALQPFTAHLEPEIRELVNVVGVLLPSVVRGRDEHSDIFRDARLQTILAIYADLDPDNRERLLGVLAGVAGAFERRERRKD